MDNIVNSADIKTALIYYGEHGRYDQLATHVGRNWEELQSWTNVWCPSPAKQTVTEVFTHDGNCCGYSVRVATCLRISSQ